MNRRAFIALSGAALFSALVIAFVGPRRLYRRLRHAYAKWRPPSIDRKATQLAAQLPHLRFAKGACLQFVVDFMEAEKVDTNFQFHPTVLKRFLLSTDYVQHRGDMNRTINYITHYSPYVAPCYNPFNFIA